MPPTTVSGHANYTERAMTYAHSTHAMYKISFCDGRRIFTLSNKYIWAANEKPFEPN